MTSSTTDLERQRAASLRPGAHRSHAQARVPAARTVARLVISGSAASARFASGQNHYLVTGSDESGAWAMAWTLEPEFRDWDDGAAAQAAAPAEFAPLVGAACPPTAIRCCFAKWVRRGAPMRRGSSR